MLGAHTRRLADSFGASRKINRLTRVQNVTEQRRERERERDSVPRAHETRDPIRTDALVCLLCSYVGEWMETERTCLFIECHCHLTPHGLAVLCVSLILGQLNRIIVVNYLFIPMFGRWRTPVQGTGRRNHRRRKSNIVIVIFGIENDRFDGENR